MTTDRDDPVEANRKAWEQAAPYHRANRHADLLSHFAEPGYSCLDDIATERLRALGVQGKAVAQLCCNNGREVVSARNLGAARGVGFDQAAAFIAQAEELAKAASIDCEFVATDVNRIAAEYDAAFDIVMVTIGVFGWMPDLNRFIGTAARLLKPGGCFFAYEQHPIVEMYEPGDPEEALYSYFRREPFVEAESLDYYGNAEYEAETHYWFHHTLADILTGCIGHGLAIEHFQEYPNNISSANMDVFENRTAQLPLSYTLVARKAG